MLKAQYCPTMKAFFGDASIKQTKRRRAYWIFGSVGDLNLTYQCNDLRLCLAVCWNMHEMCYWWANYSFLFYIPFLTANQPAEKICMPAYLSDDPLPEKRRSTLNADTTTCENFIQMFTVYKAAHETKQKNSIQNHCCHIKIQDNTWFQ